jgi:hypothetical protein
MFMPAFLAASTKSSMVGTGSSGFSLASSRGRFAEGGVREIHTLAVARDHAEYFDAKGVTDIAVLAYGLAEDTT